MEGNDKKDKGGVFSRSIRAGRRTYFLDVRTTPREDFYVTITESKKRINRDGTYFFEKHKLFLYPEDFEKFMEGMETVIEYVKQNENFVKPSNGHAEENGEFYDVNFDDLDKAETES